MIVKIEEVISEYSVRNKSNEDIPVYSVTNEKGFCTGYFSKEVASKDKSTYKIVPRGYFAYNPSRINVGSVDWQKYENRVIVSPLYVVFGVSDKLDQQYLLHYLKSDMMLSFIKEYATGSVRDNLKLSDLGKLPINLRPIGEQRCIAATLDKVSDLIVKHRQQLDKLDELVKSRFIEMFGDMESNPKCWKQSTLGEECYYIKDGPHKSPKYLEGTDGIPFISTRNVVNRDGIDWSTAKYISEADYLECIKKCHPEKGDILYSKGGTTGIAKLVDTDIKFANWVHVAVLKFEKQLDGRFLECMLNMDYCYAQSQALTKGIANKDFVLSSIAQIKIYVPPIELQEQFAAFVTQTDKSKYSHKKSIEFYQYIEKSIKQEWLLCQTLAF